jgi:hypothetical protein
MKNILKCLFISVLSLALGGCFISHESGNSRFMKRIVKQDKLKNGKLLKSGYKQPTSAMQCKKVERQMTSWGMDKFKGNFNWGGSRNRLRKQAVAYVNAHPNKNINYAYLQIPSTTSVGAIDFGFMKKAYVTYYSCKKPPATHNSPF